MSFRYGDPSNHRRCLPAPDKTYQPRDDQPRQPQAPTDHQACYGESDVHGGPVEKFYAGHVILISVAPLRSAIRPPFDELNTIS